MWWILWVVVALVCAALLFDKSPEIQALSEKTLGFKPGGTEVAPANERKGVIPTKMGMKYVLRTDDIFVRQDGERQSPDITLTCTYGTPYMAFDPKTAVKPVLDDRGAEVADLRVSLDNHPAVTAVADIDEAGKLYIRGAQSAAKALAAASAVTFYVNTVAGLQSASFDIPEARQALGMLASGCPRPPATSAAPK